MRAWLAKTMKTFRSAKDWETDWKVGTRFDGPPGEEEFTPVYSGHEATKEADITETGAWCISYIALIPKDIAGQTVFPGTTYIFCWPTPYSATQKP